MLPDRVVDSTQLCYVMQDDLLYATITVLLFQAKRSLRTTHNVEQQIESVNATTGPEPSLIIDSPLTAPSLTSQLEGKPRVLVVYELPMNADAADNSKEAQPLGCARMGLPSASYSRVEQWFTTLK
ncbi:hypothetical protein ATCC90586_009997 [Pythium insidiosum]|nr:hypothetical protein ATCC90586_009997 [Pythium insidiosum]